MAKQSQFLSLTINASASSGQEELLTYTYEKVKAVVNGIKIVDGGSSVFE
jgi:hypothetical protein